MEQQTRRSSSLQIGSSGGGGEGDGTVAVVRGGGDPEIGFSFIHSFTSSLV